MSSVPAGSKGLTRREFGAQLLVSALTVTLVDFLSGDDLVVSRRMPFVTRWLAEVDRLSREVKGGTIRPTDWQTKVEELCSNVDLREFLATIDFDRLADRFHAFNDKGAISLAVDFPRDAGIPTRLTFGRQLFGLKKGRSIVPHGHDGMATAFLVVKGVCRGRHYDRIADEKEHMIILPTIDQTFGPGGTSSISDQRNNVHWFEALTDSAFVFNIHVTDLPGTTKTSRRLYIDPQGEKIQGGTIRARRLDYDQAVERYG